VHWHGLDVPALADGHPRLAVDAGRGHIYDFVVSSRRTYWYHPHPHMRTGAQVIRDWRAWLSFPIPKKKRRAPRATRSCSACCKIAVRRSQSLVPGEWAWPR
jgi:hypothetical protein